MENSAEAAVPSVTVDYSPGSNLYYGTDRQSSPKRPISARSLEASGHRTVEAGDYLAKLNEPFGISAMLKVLMTHMSAVGGAWRN
jgi:hypothetical protein